MKLLREAEAEMAVAHPPQRQEDAEERLEEEPNVLDAEETQMATAELLVGKAQELQVEVESSELTEMQKHQELETEMQMAETVTLVPSAQLQASCPAVKAAVHTTASCHDDTARLPQTLKQAQAREPTHCLFSILIINNVAADAICD